jgi:outer membrane protein OmpA-like peptidoglycan-associated protein
VRQRSGLAVFAVLSLLVSAMSFTGLAANAAPDGPVDCSNAGTFTIANDVVVSSSGCEGQITIPAGVAVGSNAFAASPNITQIAFLGNIPLGAPWGTSSGVMVSRGVSCGNSGYFVIWETTVVGRHNCTGAVVVPEGVTQIGFSAFDADPGYGGVGHPNEGRYNNSSVSTNITSLTLPSTVTSIGDFAFRNGQFPALTLSDSVTSIGLAAFAGSTMTSISIGNGLSTISPWVFSGLSSLTSVTFGTGLRLIDEAAFSDAVALSQLTIPDSVESIGYKAFGWYHDGSPVPVRVPTLNYCGNANLTDTGLPNPASNVSTCAPASPLSLSATGADASVGISFTPGAVGGSPITNYKYSINGGPFIALSPARATSPVTISGLVTGTSYSARLKAVSDLGDGPASRPLTFIAGGSAYSDPAIGGVTAPVAGATPVNSVTAANGYSGTVTWTWNPSAFKIASAYTATITLTPDAGYTLVGVPANFYTVAGATSVTHSTSSGVITAVFPPTSGDGEFDCGTSGTAVLASYVVTDANNCVGAVTIPNAVTAIGDAAFRAQTGITSVTFAPGSQTVTIGTGAFFIPLNLRPGALASISIPSSVTTIGNGAFQYTALESITFAPNSQLTTIDTHAFKGVPRLESIVIPSSVTTIGLGAFREMPSLRSVTFEPGSQLTDIYSYAFYDASSLSALALPDSLQTIGTSAFEGAVALSSVSFGVNSNLNYIGAGAFYGASSLTSIAIPDTVQTIASVAFENAASLTSVTFGAGSALGSIGDGAFRGASSLTDIDLPDNNPEVGSYAFYGTAASLFASSYVNWRTPLQPNSNAPKIGEKVFASAFEKHLPDFGTGGIPEEYVYRITKQENVPTSSVDLQANGVYHSLTEAEQNQWYEDIGFDPVSAPANNPYLFSWRAFMCVAEVNGAVTIRKPNNLSLSYASRDYSGSSAVNHWMLFKNASEQLQESSASSTRTVTGLIYNATAHSAVNGPDVDKSYYFDDLDTSTAPYSFGISEVYSSCGAGKNLEGLQIVDVGGAPLVTKDFEITPSLKLKRGGDFFTHDAGGITIGVTGAGGPPPQFAGSFNAALWGLTTIASPTPVISQPSTYLGPLANLFSPRILISNQPQTVRVSGERLDQVTGMSHKGVALSFSIISAREIEVKIPALTVGIKEIKFDAGSSGIITHINAFEVKDPYLGTPTASPIPEPSSPGVSSPLRASTIWGFVAGSTRLDSKGVKNLSNVASRLASAKEISCVGYTMGPTALARDIQLSYNRAMTVCKRLAASIPGAKIIKVEGRQDTRTGDRVRRVEVKWRG